MEKNLLTIKELNTIKKKLDNKNLTQEDSNRLSRFIRPKLKMIKSIDSEYLLNRLSYNPKSIGIENNIKELVLKKIKNIKAIVIYGSAILSGYNDYRDIDVIILTKNKMFDNKWENLRFSRELEKESRFPLDIQIIDEKTFIKNYSNNASWIYQLKDSKTIYGNIKIPKNIRLTKMDLRMKLDWSDLDYIPDESKEIYNAIRNTILVRLLMNKIIDNGRLINEIKKELGTSILEKLRNNTASALEKKYALKYLKDITEKTRKEIIDSKWEEIKI
jgi:predicted nucleotidyltransferase